MTGVFGQLPDDQAATLSTVLESRDPALRLDLENTDEPTIEQRRAVEDALSDELMSQIQAPAWEPTLFGQAIERTIDAFLARFPTGAS